jgi:hypothetical protein
MSELTKVIIPKGYERQTVREEERTRIYLEAVREVRGTVTRRFYNNEYRDKEIRELVAVILELDPDTIEV